MISKYKTQYMTCTSLVVGLPTIYWCQVVGYSAVVPCLVAMVVTIESKVTINGKFYATGPRSTRMFPC